MGMCLCKCVYVCVCVCVCVFCRWLEEPAASGSVRKHLIKDGVEGERGRRGRKENRGGRDEGGVAGWSVEHPSHLLPTSLISSYFLCLRAKVTSFKHTTHLLLL